MTRYNVITLVPYRYNVIKSVMMLLDASIYKHLFLKAVCMCMRNTRIASFPVSTSKRCYGMGLWFFLE